MKKDVPSDKFDEEANITDPPVLSVGKTFLHFSRESLNSYLFSKMYSASLTWANAMCVVLAVSSFITGFRRLGK